ncbi:tetraspanin-9-like isoform X2 [Artemia franciscana]|uniref:tetraspanin-9-like isoform X2 n=1 Tax=Artemia franciscana TaxID=6661 RepID=UPI0032DB4CAC
MRMFGFLLRMGHGTELEGCGKCIKYTMFLSNFLILFGGIAVLAVGIWTLVEHAYLETLVGTNLYKASAVILVITGSIVSVISFLGCMGAVKEVKCLLLTYFILMFGIFITMLVGGILAYAFRDKVKEILTARLLASVPEAYNNQTQNPRSLAITEAWDLAQRKMNCCGVEGNAGYAVWRKMNKGFQPPNPNVVPRACCKLNSDKTPMSCQATPTEKNAHLNGCFPKILQTITDSGTVVGGVGVGIAFVMLLGMIFSMALFKAII